METLLRRLFERGAMNYCRTTAAMEEAKRKPAVPINCRLRARAGPRLQLLDAHVAATALDDALRARIMDAVDRAQRNAETAIDTFVEHDGETPEEIFFDAIDRINLAGAGVIAGAASDAGFVDVVMSRLVRHQSGKIVTKVPEALMNSCKL